MNYTDTEATQRSDFLSAADVLAIERGIPRLRWNAALNQRVGRVGLLGRLTYYSPWVDYYYTRLWANDAASVQDAAYGSRFSPVTPRGLSGGYYYARINYRWGR